MPVQLRSITGKVDYQVEQVIRDLVLAANRQETETAFIIQETDFITREVRPQITQLATTVGSLGDLARVSKVQGDSITNIISSGVTVSGLPVADQLAVWASPSAIKGDAALTFDGTTVDAPQLNLARHGAMGDNSAVDFITFAYGGGYFQDSALIVEERYTSTAGEFLTALYMELDPSGTQVAHSYAADVHTQTRTTNSQDFAGFFGFFGSAYHQGSGTVTLAGGADGQVRAEVGTIITGHGLRGIVSIAGGNITNARAVDSRVDLTGAGNSTHTASFYARAHSDSGAGAITNSYGLFVEAMTVAANNVGALIAKPSGGTNNTALLLGTTAIPVGDFAIYSAGTEISVFKGPLSGGTAAGEDLTLQSTSNATRGHIFFGSGQASGWDDVNSRLGLGTITPEAKLNIVQDGAGSDSPFIGARYSADGSGSGLLFRKARGSVASPTQVLITDSLGAIVQAGYHSGGDFGGTVAAYVALAIENFTSTAQGTILIWQTTPGTTITPETQLVLTDQGNLLIGAASILSNPNGTAVLFFDDQTAPTTMPANTAGVYANDDGGTVKMYAVDEAGSDALLNYRNIALGGGAAPTLGTIGGSGPTVAAQQGWIELNQDGTAYWVPAWV